MREFTVAGKDSDTGSPVVMDVRIGSVGEAAEFAARRGISVEEVRASDGKVFRANGKGGFSLPGEEGSGGLDGPDAALLVFALLIPLVGIIAGAIRLAQRDASGGKVLTAGLIGTALWTLLALAF